MDDALVIALCRHGLTEANKRRTYLGWSDSPLLLYKSALVRTYDGFYGSDLGRCVETMRRLYPEARPILLSDLREMNFGHFEGLSYEDLKDLPSYQRWLAHYQSEGAPGGGESFADFKDRVAHGFKNICESMIERNEATSFVVTHAGVIRLILALYAPIEKDYWDWEVDHEHYFELTFKKHVLIAGERASSLRTFEL